MRSKAFRVLLCAAALLMFSVSLQAQATRTWVSGVGDDVNPCSRTAPCKTFAGAISKTAAGGEISVLDPGGFGALTITKPITINGNGSMSSMLAAQVNGVVINIMDTTKGDAVVLRDLFIEGAGTGINGIRIIGKATVYIDNVRIGNFTKSGIAIEPTAGNPKVTISEARIFNTEYGVRATPAAAPGSGIILSVIDSEIHSSKESGIMVSGATKTMIAGTTVTGSGKNGLDVAGGEVYVDGSSFTLNTGAGVAASSGKVDVTGTVLVGNSRPTMGTVTVK